MDAIFGQQFSCHYLCHQCYFSLCNALDFRVSTFFSHGRAFQDLRAGVYYDANGVFVYTMERKAAELLLIKIENQ